MFNTLLIQPLFNSLVFLYEYATFQDLGLAIILLTIIIRFILFPLFYTSFHNQAVMQKLQPEIQKIQHNHKDNREEQAKALLELYRIHKVNPFSGILLILVQLPILIALYKVFLDGISPDTLLNLYDFIPKPGNVSSLFLNLIDLAKPSILIVGLAAVFQFIQGKMMLPKYSAGLENTPTFKMAKQMAWMAPVLTVVILYTLPAAVGLYWATTSVFSVFQQAIINKKVYGSNQINNSKNAGTDGI